MYFSFFTDRTIKIGAALLGTCLACCHITQANVAERDAQFVEGLRQRRMFTLAESFCRRRLAEPDLTVVHRIQLITELSRCYATQAVHHTGPQRDEYWARAVAVIEDWNPQFEHNPHFLVARAQHALVNLARGEIARQELELQTPGTQDWELARQPLRKAIAELEALQLEATSHLQQSLSVNQTISKFELESFLANVQHQSSRAHHNRALTYSPDSADRLNDLNLSLEQLQRLVRVSADPRIGWKSQLDRMMVLRLLGQLDQAHEAAAALLAVNMNVVQRRQVQVELIRLALAEDNLPQALELVESMASVPRPPPADLAVLETWIAAWKQATENPERAEMWQARIANALRTLGDTHGDYWRRRGGALVAFAAQTGTHSNHLELMVQTAQDLYANHQWDDAVQAYLRAAEQAKTRRDLDRAFRLQLSAGRIEHDRKTYDAAIHLWRSFALDHRDHREAPEMHWLAVGAAAQTAAEATPAQPLTDATSPYLSLLTEHLAQWPEAATAIEAHWWLGQLRERQGEWAAAVEHYRAIPPEAHVANQALQALRRCWKRWWESPQPPGQPVDERIDEALRHCDRLVQDSHQRLPQRWSPLARTAAVVGAQIRLQFFPAEAVHSEPILQAALRNSGTADPAWQSEARSTLILLFVQTQRVALALETWYATNDSVIQPQDLDLLLRRLSQQSTLLERERQSLAELCLEIANQYLESSDTLSNAQSLRAERIRAKSLARLGRREAALEILATLARQHPRDGATQETWALLLIDSEAQVDVERSLDLWRSIAHHSRQKSERWYRAKYYLALAHFRLGNRNRATEVLRWVEAIPPGFAGSSMRQDFDQLLESVSQ